jgi:hypothetical protein
MFYAQKHPQYNHRILLCLTPSAAQYTRHFLIGPRRFSVSKQLFFAPWKGGGTNLPPDQPLNIYA